MPELKTLKDLECKGNTLDGIRERWLSETELKAEVIKWVKHNLEQIKPYSSILKIENGNVFFKSEDQSQQHIHYRGAIQQFVKFFNLTSEDLK